jgi:hypothetical protein
MGPGAAACHQVLRAAAAGPRDPGEERANREPCLVRLVDFHDERFLARLGVTGQRGNPGAPDPML